MSVSKYHSVEEMPPIGRCPDDELVERMRAVWNRAFLLCPPNFPHGVMRFGSIEEANSARQQMLHKRMNPAHETHPPDNS